MDHAKAASEILSAVGNAKRLIILCHLLDGELAVGVLAKAVGLSQSALSQHLAKLRSSGVVSRRRDAQTGYYSSSSVAVLAIFEALKRIFDADHLSTVKA
ncbi:ArsR/SmtB family transcription factor (plasmid) [Agrobacterium sp. rho-13.3]|uniref:ArsR/SmtB family transcription factor n=1 Tax=Agrobacterium sp. rho-13.3 TaxID=3072980 RepID=UPI002A0EC985|nr:metalloregulator ArsR/SmtB family transcription factor [Agrobacterium sp. rho-13.3]MDX8311875.1 metalloregulator ArsR/SmtB family transcription factor [Agrobacterium sp. rho-13.3]